MNSGPTLATGSQGEDVRRLQRVLVMVKLLGHTDIDGVFGPKTDGAVRSVQESDGLAVDGICGPNTWGVLPPDPNTPLLSQGSTGPVVSALQQALLTHGGQGSPTDPGPVDGDFGSNTKAAVQAYQSDRGVGVDGIVGDHTWWVPAGGAGATLASLAGLTTA